MVHAMTGVVSPLTGHERLYISGGFELGQRLVVVAACCHRLVHIEWRDRTAGK